MPLEDVDDQNKIKIAETLINMYGDKKLLAFYTEQKMSKLMKLEKMLEEILYESQSTVKAYLKEDDMFGEQAALRDGVRSASVRATEDCHLAYLDKEDFDYIYQIHWKAKVDRGIQFLRAITLFSSLSKHYIQRMTSMLHRREVIKG